MKIQLISPEDVLDINHYVCSTVNQKSLCFDKGKVESALSAAFYPGDYPFQYRGIVKVAGALCFFIIKAHAFMDGNKRTAALASTMLLQLNNYELIYPQNIQSGITAFTDIIEKTASSQINKEDLIQWFDNHKKIIKFPYSDSAKPKARALSLTLMDE